MPSRQADDPAVGAHHGRRFPAPLIEPGQQRRQGDFVVDVAKLLCRGNGPSEELLPDLPFTAALHVGRQGHDQRTRVGPTCRCAQAKVENMTGLHPFLIGQPGFNGVHRR